jgi:hypothetical protein
MNDKTNMSLKSSNVIIIPITMFSTVNIFDKVILMLLSVRTTLNVRILMDLTSVCVMMDTSDLEMFVLVSIPIRIGAVVVVIDW